MSIRALRDAGFAAIGAAEDLRRYADSRGGHPASATQWQLPFTHAAALMRGEPKLALNLDATRATAVSNGTSLLVSGFPEALFSRLSLGSHGVRTPSLDALAMTLAAFDFLDEYYAEGHQFSAEYVKLLVFVDRFGQRADGHESLLTSCSLPAMPYCTFVSEKAFVHLPPLHLAREPDAAIFAENIVHEALHNALTVDILARRIFRSGFKASAWPSVSIPWRAHDAAERNRAWPIDRALHALFVYVGLTGMRLHLLHGPSPGASRREFLASTLPSAANAMVHLAQSLAMYEDCFADAAIKSVAALRRQAFDLAANIGRTA